MSAADVAVDHFRTHGWMRVPAAFGHAAAAAMRDAVWRALARTGVDRADPSTWTVPRPAGLQSVRSDAAFGAVGSEPVLRAITNILDEAAPRPKNWGSAFVAFPSGRDWAIPVDGWHIDAHPCGALEPARGLKTFALFGDVAPRSGGTLLVSGSHRLVHRWFRERPPAPGARNADMRRSLREHSWLRDLQTDGDPEARIRRFMGASECVDGIELSVAETSGAAGDVFLVHPLLIHSAAPNAGSAPRFLLSGGVTLDLWGWDRER